MKGKLIVASSLLLLVVTLSFVSALYADSTFQAQPTSFQNFYSSTNLPGMLWPSLDDPATCKARQDILLQVAPFGCQPMVVRSDLLADQNVPVLCQIMGVKINPLIDVKNIRNIRFTGNYPEEVATVGFHPSRVALGATNEITGGPLISNIGYVVVVLKRNPNEAQLPKFVNVTLSAQVDYTAGNAFGIGRTTFLLKEENDQQWQEDKIKQSFWSGKYSVRLESADDNSAVISLYNYNQKINTIRVDKNKPSADVYLPGTFCQVALRIYYDGFESANTRAVIEVSDDSGAVDKLVLYKGSKFLNDKCTVRDVVAENNSFGFGFGKADIICNNDQFTLSRTLRILDYKLGQDVLMKVDKKINPAGFVDAKITKITSDGKYDVIYAVGGKTTEKAGLTYNELSPKIIVGTTPPTFLENRDLGSVQGSFNDAIAAYLKVIEDYPQEKPNSASLETYGELAFEKAIALAGGDSGQQKTKYELINKFIEKYPNSFKIEEYRREIKDSYNVNSDNSAISVNVDNRFRVIRLLSVDTPTEQPSADINIDLIKSNIKLGASISLGVSANVAAIDVNSISISYRCNPNDGLTSELIQVGTSKQICGKVVKLDNTNVEKSAKIRIEPEARGAQLETNLSVNIGIEKRAIQLSPAKRKEMIKNLNESIAKWESISKKLTKVVTGLKATCLVTSAALTLKNFASGLSGETVARQQVMNGDNGWKKICEKAIVTPGDPYHGKSLSACLSGHSADIAKDVEATKNAINKVDEAVKNIEKGASTSGGFLQDKSVNTTKAKAELATLIIRDHGTEDIPTPNGFAGDSKKTEIKVSDLFVSGNLDKMTYSEMRDIYMNLERRKSGGLSDNQKENVGSLLGVDTSRISDKISLSVAYAAAQKDTISGIPGTGDSLNAGAAGRIYREVVTKDTLTVAGLDEKSSNNFAAVFVSTSPGIVGGRYVLGLGKEDKGNYAVDEVYRIGGTKVGGKENLIKLNENEMGTFLTAYKVGTVTSQKTLSYNNKMVNPEVRYFETEPYKGMPAIVPFDAGAGWYAATRQTLPAFGGIGAFDASGRVTSFWVCNVGDKGLIEFDQGFGNDICQQVNLQTGQPLGSFNGLSEANSKAIIQRAIKAITEASRQYGNTNVVIEGQTYKTGTPMANVPESQCEDFMSPGDCKLLFNVCDPVICPPSRCNLGGAYNVPDVIQSGIIGSAVLCLPNFPEVYVPVCLSGLLAGADAYISILKNHRDCLQNSLDTGQMTGICDQIYSIYSCEFFWRQLGPFMDTLIPKIVGMAYGQGRARGGGEYGTVAAAYKNAGDSLKYFTQFYGINSFKAFQVKSIAEVGGAFCKAYVSAKGPTGLKSLAEPDSPPQYEAWFDAIPYTSATLPATSQYKVFYHIFAGKSANGVYYNVYLKNPPTSSYYSYSPTLQVPGANGFISQGQYASDTKDFTAPEGYKELCININGDEKCGFKQVSTSFAVNYLRDQYVQDQLQQKEITTENGCISGTPSAGALLANTNPLSAVQEAVLPADYNRGIIRICATADPGSSTSPGRFKDVGYCGDQKVKCWLDTQSVQNSITPYAEGIRNDTLKNLELGINDAVDVEKVNADMAIEIDRLNNILKDASPTTSPSLIAQTLGQIEIDVGKAILNNQKAQLLYIKAQILGKIIEFSKTPEAAKVLEEAGTDLDLSNAGETGVSSDLALYPDQIKNIEVTKYLGRSGNYKFYIASYLDNDGKKVLGALRVNWGDSGDEVGFAIGDVITRDNLEVILGENGFHDIEIEGTRSILTAGFNDNLNTIDLDAGFTELRDKLKAIELGTEYKPSDSISIYNPAETGVSSDLALYEGQIANMKILSYIGDSGTFKFYNASYIDSSGKKIVGALRVNWGDPDDEVGFATGVITRDNLAQITENNGFHNIEIQGSSGPLWWDDDLNTIDLGKEKYKDLKKALDAVETGKGGVYEQSTDLLFIDDPSETATSSDIALYPSIIGKMNVEVYLGRAGDYKFYIVNYTTKEGVATGTLRVDWVDLTNEVSLANVKATISNLNYLVKNNGFHDIEIQDSSGPLWWDDNLITSDLDKPVFIGLKNRLQYAE